MPFFPRGDGPLVSIIIPTRQRPKGLCATIDSFNSLAKDSSRLEFIVKVDDDDLETIEICKQIQRLRPIKVITSPRGNGYLDTHHWVNEISLNHAKGDWLLYAHDDIVLTSVVVGADIVPAQDWDERLYHGTFLAEATWHGCPDVCSLLFSTVGNLNDAEFFFLRRKVVELLGYWSNNPCVARYMQSILCFISSSFRFPVYVTHNEDDVSKRNDGEIMEDLASLPNMRRRVEDISKLIKYIKNWQLNKAVQEKAVLSPLPKETDTKVFEISFG